MRLVDPMIKTNIYGTRPISLVHIELTYLLTTICIQTYKLKLR